MELARYHGIDPSSLLHTQSSAGTSMFPDPTNKGAWAQGLDLKSGGGRTVMAKNCGSGVAYDAL